MPVYQPDSLTGPVRVGLPHGSHVTSTSIARQTESSGGLIPNDSNRMWDSIGIGIVCLTEIAAPCSMDGVKTKEGITTSSHHSVARTVEIVAPCLMDGVKKRRPP